MLGEAAFAAQQYNITQLQVHFVSNSTQCATVVLKDEEGNVFEDAATGSGSIEAIYNAIQRILGLNVNWRIIAYNLLHKVKMHWLMFMLN